MRSVALLIETSNAYARGLLRGVRNYVLEHGPWSIYLGELRRGEAVPRWLKAWRGEGVIARIETSTIAGAVAGLKAPSVDGSAARHLVRVPFVETDDDAIAQAAMEHLRERGFRTVGFCGEARFRWSNNREAAFRKLTRSMGMDCWTYSGGS